MKMLATLRNRLRNTLLKNEKGQGATEYILLVAVVVGIVLVFGKSIKKKLSSATDQLGTNIEETVNTSKE